MRAPALACLLGALLAGCGSDPAPPPTGAMTVGVDRYDFAFDLDSRAAHAVVHLSVTGEGDCVTLPFRAEQAANVRLAGQPAQRVAVADQQLTACGAGWHAGAELALETDLVVPLRTWGASQVGYSIANLPGGGVFYYLVSWVGGCDRFGPCDHAPDRFARYHFTVTHPAGITVLCPGEITAGATETSCDFGLPGGPTYSTFGIVASDGWTVAELGDWNGVAVTLHDRPGTASLAPAIDGAYHADFLAWMEDHFGPYPYGDALRLVVGPTYWSGFEHPGNIVLDQGLDDPGSAYADPVAHVLNHELAHQWAGDQTTLAGTYDFVWKEAMAEYLSFVYEDETVPASARRTAQAWKSFAAGAAFHPVPEEQPPLLDYYGEVYGPGPMILFRQLEALFSRDDVLEALATLLGVPRALSVADVKLALEDATGADLTGYFDRWVTGSGAPSWPTVTVETVDVAGAVTVTVRQVGAEPAGCAFAVELRGAAAEERATVRIDFGVDGAAEASAAATPGFAVVSTVLDPEGECLVYQAAGAAAPPRHPPGWSPWLARPAE